MHRFLRLMRVVGQAAALPSSITATPMHTMHGSLQEYHCRNGLMRKNQIVTELLSSGYCVVDMTDNEIAKLYERHMVGGRVQAVADDHTV
jgi:hypothetical protein